jgi:inosose dehydratase
MRDVMTRRTFLAAGAVGAAGALVTPTTLTSQILKPRNRNFAVGITVDTRPDWNGAQNFIRSLDEASALGWRMIETFPNYVAPWMNENNWQGLKDVLDQRNMAMITISGGGNFTDPAQREQTIEYNLNICRFQQPMGSVHLKINVGGEQPRGQASQTPQIYREMARTMNELGERITDMGMRFGVHAHLDSAFETRQDVDALMEMTDPRHVWFILDTGHITMAGMDPVQLTRDYLSRIVEYHMKDVHPEDRGGSRRVMGRMIVPTGGGGGGGGQQGHPEYPGIPMDQLPASIRFRDRHFYEMGRGGVDFPQIIQILTEANWSGYLTAELDSTITTSMGSATVNKEYMERVLGLDVESPNQRPNWNG